MFGFGARKREGPGREPSTDGPLIYAVGDVHGRLDLLDDLLDQIAEDASKADGAAETVLVFLGDYVDRGDASRGVIDRLIGLAHVPGVELKALKGNHEQVMLDFLRDPEVGPGWVQQGGAATLASYGVAAPQTRVPADPWAEASKALARALPPEHLQFLNGLPLYAEYGDYVFVHAGLRPGVPLDRQSERDLLWIRAEFLDETRPFPKVVVHGHTPATEPFLGAHRLGLDTGAYATGILTAARLFGTERTVLQATAHGDRL